jgi:2-isopropylmalate synthase
VFGLDKNGIIDVAVNGRKLCRKLEDAAGDTKIRYEYSPESFTGTEPEFAIEVCEAVMDVVEPTPDNPIVLNLPATVECTRRTCTATSSSGSVARSSNRDSVISRCTRTTTAAVRSPLPSSA